MAVAFVQATKGDGGHASTTTLATSAFGSSTTAGNALFVAVYWDNSNSVTLTSITDSKSNSGWAIIGSPYLDANNNRVQHAYCLNIASAGASHTVTANWSGNAVWPRIVAFEVSGILASGALDKDSGGNEATGTNVSATSITPTTTGQFIFASVLNSGGAAADTFSQGSGMIEPANATADAAANEAMCEYQIQTTATAIAAPFVRTASGLCTMRVSSFKAAVTEVPGAALGPGLVIGSPLSFVGEGAIGAPDTEIVAESKWHQSWSDPRRDKIVKAFAVAMIASGGALTPYPPPTVVTPTTILPLSEPIRQKSGLSASRQQFLALTKADPFPETPAVDKWFTRLAEPTRRPKQTTDLIAFVPPDSSQYYRWWQPLSEPIRIKQQIDYPEPVLAVVTTTPETVTADKWFSPLSHPTGRPKRTADLIAFVPLEFSDQSGWRWPLFDPIRIKRQVDTGEPAFIPVVTVAPEIVTVDKWFQSFEIVWRHRFNPTGGEAFVPVVITTPETITVDKWFQSFEIPWWGRFIPLSGAISDPIVAAPSENVTVDKWLRQFEIPGRASIRPRDLTIFTWEDVAKFWWQQPLSIPSKRARSALPEFGVVPAVTAASPEVVTADKWFVSFGQIIRARLLPSAQQQTYADPASIPVPPPSVPSMAGWSYGWSGPVRLHVLSTATQSDATGPVLPQPNPIPPVPVGVYTVSGLYVIDQFTDNTVVYDYDGRVSHRTN